MVKLIDINLIYRQAMDDLNTIIINILDKKNYYIYLETTRITKTNISQPCDVLKQYNKIATNRMSFNTEHDGWFKNIT